MCLSRLAVVAAAVFIISVHSSQAAADGGFLTGDFSPIAAGSNINLSVEGSADWAHWGLHTENSYNHKANVSPEIGNYIVIGNRWAAAWPYADNYNGYSWTNGTPEARVENTPTGVYVAGLGNGIELSILATTNARTLKLFVGTYGAQGRIEATLSDHSAPAFVATNISNVTNGPGGVYTLRYAAAKDNETLLVTYRVSAMYVTSFGNVTLQAATLSVDGANVVPEVWVNSPTQHQVFCAPASVFCQASANDSDGTIAKIELFNGTNQFSEVAASTCGGWLSDLPAGTYEIFARAIDNGGAMVSSAPVRFHVLNKGGYLSGCVAAPTVKIDLTYEGDIDWVHWGHVDASGFNQKNSATEHISNFTVLGGNLPEQYANNFTAFSWNDGTPTPMVTDTSTGVYVIGANGGFELVIPADAARRRLNLYVGLYAARGTLEASLSDFSAAPFLDSSLSSLYGDAYGRYSIDFAAASSNQTLRITYKAAQVHDLLYGNVTLQAATLANLSTAAIENPRYVGGQFLFDVVTESNRTYSVQWSEFSTFVTWNILTNLTGDGGTITVSDPASSSSPRFYRLR